MSDLTYEYENCSQCLETYEWDKVWWEHANTEGVPRVLYIGDSIAHSTWRAATDVANYEIYFDGFGTSKAVDNPYFADSLRIFAAQQGDRRVVLFNNGLHGWHLDDASDYAQAYEKMLVFLLKEFAGTPLVLLLTTHVANVARDKRVQTRNQAVSALAEKYNLPVLDLYTFSKEHESLLTSDGVHYTPEGYRLLAAEIVKKVREFLP